MKELKLISLRFKNFKGFKSFEINPDGKNLEIKGDNATCKTTIYDGFMWLFTEKDASGKKNFQIKPTDKTGIESHNIETEVKGVFRLNNAKKFSLKRVYKEVYTKKTGTITKELTGHTTTYFIDGDVVAKKKYDLFLEEIMPLSIFKLITNLFKFNRLSWEKRREIVFGICGEASDNDIISSCKALFMKYYFNMVYLLSKIKQVFLGVLILAGLLLAGSECSTIELQLIANILGLILFVLGGYFFVGECRKI